jgi:hypothetical protein
LICILIFKPAVSSRVIATPREIPSRQEVIRRERTDERSRQRNKRMFGALLGTLQKFRQEETKLKAKVSYIQIYLYLVSLSSNYTKFHS